MTLGALRVSAIALSAAAFVLSSPLSAADAATVAHHSGYAAHPRVSHGLHGRVAHAHAGHRHYVWRTLQVETTLGKTGRFALPDAAPSSRLLS